MIPLTNSIILTNFLGRKPWVAPFVLVFCVSLSLEDGLKPYLNIAIWVLKFLFSDIIGGVIIN